MPMTEPIAVPIVDAGSSWFSRRWLMLPVILVATLMGQFDLYVVNVALPVLQHQLGASQAEVELFVGAYAFTYAAGMITGGRLGDIFGHRRVFILGMAGFGITSALCGLSASGWTLIGGRLLQGVTAAMMVPQVLALITACFPPHERRRALGWFGVTIGVGALAGQVIGGLLLQADVFGLGWRAIFFVNIPVAIITVALAIRYLPARSFVKRTPLDVPGAIGTAVTLGLVLFPLIAGRSTGWSWWTWAMLLAAVLAGFLTIGWERRLERRQGHPVLPVTLFRIPAFRAGLLLGLVTFGWYFAFVFCTTLLLQNGLGLDALHAGLMFAPTGLAFAVASLAARRFAQRHGAGTIAVGQCISALTLASMLTLCVTRGGDITPIQMIVPMAVIGIGNGISMPAIIGEVLHQIPTRQAGSASGVLTTAQQFASAAGIATIGGLYFATLTNHTRTNNVSAEALSIICELALSTVAIVTALWLGHRQR